MEEFVKSDSRKRNLEFIDSILHVSNIDIKNTVYYTIHGSVLNSENLSIKISSTSKLSLLEAGPISKMELFQDSTGFLDGGNCKVNDMLLKTSSTGNTKNFTVSDNLTINAKGSGDITLRLYSTGTETIKTKGRADIQIDRI